MAHHLSRALHHGINGPLGGDLAFCRVGHEVVQPVKVLGGIPAGGNLVGLHLHGAGRQKRRGVTLGSILFAGLHLLGAVSKPIPLV